MTSRTRTLISLSAALTLAGCWSETYEYPSAQYVNRTQTITPSAGNAQEINEATQVIDPWRRDAGNRNIPANGDRMVNAAERYRAKAPAGGTTQPGGSPVGGAPTTPGSSPSGNTLTPPGQ